MVNIKAIGPLKFRNNEHIFCKIKLFFFGGGGRGLYRLPYILNAKINHKKWPYAIIDPYTLLHIIKNEL